MDLYEKLARVTTALNPHQERLLEKLRASGGVLAAWQTGGGKCVRAGTTVLTDQGVLPIERLFPEPYAGGEETLPAGSLRVPVLSDGKTRWVRLRGLYRQTLSPEESTLRIETRRGHSLRCTRAHPLYVVREGALTWVRADEVKVGDWVAMAKSLPEGHNPVGVDDDTAILLTWQITEGWEHTQEASTVITQADQTVLQALQERFKRLHPASTSGHVRSTQGQAAELHIWCGDWRKRLRNLGYRWGRKSANKAFPATFVHLPQETLRALLRAVFDAEGSRGDHNVELTTASYTLAQQICYMLLRFGIRTSLHEKWGRATNGTRAEKTCYWRLTISGEDLKVFDTQIEFGYPYKQTRKGAETRANPNMGVPCAWLQHRCDVLGLPRMAAGFPSAAPRTSCSNKTGQLIVQRLYWLASAEGQAYYRNAAKRLNGPMRDAATRTASVLATRQEELCLAAKQLSMLLTYPLRYEPVTSITPDENGGVVYDLIVDADNYDARSYVGGTGGFILHNTLGAINAAEELDEPTEYVVPAPLQANMVKEYFKHTRHAPGPDVRIRSYEKAVKDQAEGLHPLDTSGLVVFDEAQRGRNPGTGPEKLLREAMHAKHRLLLSASPTYNQPENLAPLLNAAAGRKVLPDDPAIFRAAFVGQKVDQPSLWLQAKGKLLGHEIRSDPYPALINRERLVQAAKGYVDVFRGSTEGYPEKLEEDHFVEMSPKQMELYDFAAGKMPWYLRAKIRSGLPLTKQESSELNAFQGALRQVSNTPRGFDQSITDEDEHEHSPKINKVIEHLTEARANDPNHRGIIYSNYLDSGVFPLSRALNKAGIAHHIFTGAVPTQRRAEMVKDYNEGRVPVLLLSGAGSEGLDLKGTKTIQLLEPHWNPERTKQVEGRGIRYLSHAHLPEAERKVRVMRYHSTLPKSVGDRAGWFLGKDPPKSIDEYLKHMSKEKGRLGDEIADALQEASDAGPLKRANVKMAAQDVGLPDAVVDQIVARMGDTQRERIKKKNVLTYTHPSGVVLHSPYQADFIARNVREKFEGNADQFADQLRDDLLNMGYASLGQVEKKNEQKRLENARKGMGYGGLIGAVLGTPLSIMAVDYTVRSPKWYVKAPAALFAATHALGPIPEMVAGGTAGWHIGKYLTRPLGVKDLEGTNTHPLLMPPKEIKQKVKLEVKDK